MGFKKEVVILGAGLCGLYAAITLLKRGWRVTLLEKERQPGGLAAGHFRGGNYYDLGVHMLHAFDIEVFNQCAELMGDERIEVPLNARIKWAGSLYHYPLRGRDILRGIPPWTLSRCLLGLLIAEIQTRLGRGSGGDGDGVVDGDTDAEQALISLYGTPLYEFFFEDFTHRYWGIHPRDLSATFIRNKMPRLSAVDVIKNALRKCHLAKPTDQVEGALRFETLHYSATGAETLPRCLAKEVRRLGGEIHLESEVTEVCHVEGAVTSVQWRDVRSGEFHEHSYSHCLSTLPIPLLIRAMVPAAPVEVLDHVRHLRYKPMVVFGLLVRKPQCMKALYTYYRERVFHRVGEPKNGGLKVQPDGHTLLIVEMTCEADDAKWRGDDAVYQQVLKDLAAENLCGAEDVVECHHLKATHAYPIFDKGFESHLEAIQHYLDGITNLISTGRQGGFTYPNMHAAMRMGKNAALDLMGEGMVK